MNYPTHIKLIRRVSHASLLPLLFASMVSACSSGNGVTDGTGGTGANNGNNPIKPGQTSFESEELGDQGRAGQKSGAPAADAASGAENAPGGRMGEVEEADIYRMAGDRLFYLNTYRGFVIYDVTNTKAPVRMSRLPVYGYPIEMFVEGNTVYALLRDALYLTQESGRMRFNRHNTSQLVSIDVTDARNPRVLQTIDIVGELREGVSRKIANTVYVVSSIPQSYYYGWNYPGSQTAPKEQAWVYSFNVADPRSVKQVQKLQIFEGGSIDFNDPKLGISLNRYFQSVAISATSNALMVVENWYISAYQNQTDSKEQFYRCGSYQSDQQAVVSIVDISDPTGVIRLHTKFETTGNLTDQFKMTYVYDAAQSTGTFFGIFARNGWSSSNCDGQSFTENVIESWDVTNGASPRRLSGLVFGKRDETVRGSAFDVERKLAYAITARQIDPLYVIDLSDRQGLKILSAIDGLSGDMNVFRLIADRQFLIGIGRDNSATCEGLQNGTNRQPTNVAVSIIDVRNPAAARLVQRECVAVENAEWVGSAVNSDLDQAHKMIGMHSEGNVNVITVPVYYYRRSQENEWWWYQSETAVGLMTWNLANYDATKPPEQQTVLQNFGTVVHPQGEVRRSAIFKHQSSGRRMMMNLSDTHISVVDLQDLSKPVLDSVIELAPYQSEIFGFGNHVVEHIQSSPYYGYSQQGVSEFRVKVASGNVDDAAPVTSFRIGQVTRVLKHGNNLLLFRSTPSYEDFATKVYTQPTSTVIVVDMTDPTHPQVTGSTPVPQDVHPYYNFYCGMGGYWGGYWFDGQNNWTNVDAGVMFLNYGYDQATQQSYPLITFLDLRTRGKPSVTQTRVVGAAYDDVMGLVADAVSPAGFYLTYRDVLGTVTNLDQTFTRYGYYAQRFTLAGDSWVGGSNVNLPGRLVRTWATPAGVRVFLTQDNVYRRLLQEVEGAAQTAEPQYYWQSDYRLNLLRSINRSGVELAELRDTHHFIDRYLRDLVPSGDRLYVNAGRGGYWGYGGYYRGGGDVAVGGVAEGGGSAPATRAQTEEPDYSDSLVIFDLSNLTLAKTYDQPTGTFGMRLMGLHNGHLFVNFPGDGILAVDVADPAQPTGRQFLRTLGYASHIEFAGDNAYVAAGYFGIYQMSLIGPRVIALD